ncbi:LysR substrate-binding domain-containing protein [Azospirillum isscasi]|uniref:LysR substrate-binding domain-containing protein n=1 Tax=Azospirillum isscasi TaxID=3053926 RepID=A0ABU0WE84_9PROT|nr:LysR substrate-binding domain-containing protein [Azospirillum isscasi]MDQ2101364.1 LysR substrate-binding domain-containing protein [Azospirillum isscasi]
MPRLPFTALAAFEAASRHGSMTRAADELGLTHGAVSRQVGDLEKRLGVRLFERTPQGLLLTDGGRDLALACTAGLGRLQESWDRIAGSGPERLRVAAPRTWAALWLVPRLGRFLAGWPDVCLDIEGGNTDRVSEAEAGWAVIRYVRGGDPGPDGALLSEEPLLPVCAPSLAERLRGREELRRHTLLHYQASPDWSLWRAAAGVDLDGARSLSFSESVMVVQAAMAGQGIALGRPSLVLEALETGRLVCPFGPAVPCGDRYVLTAPAQGRGRRVLRAFRTWLLEEAAADGARLERLGVPVAGGGAGA